MLRAGKWGAVALMTACVLSGCANKTRQAPVDERSSQISRSATKPLPGAENTGKTGYYTVKPGDTLIRIGMDNGQTWRDLVRWNNLENPNLIETGQVLRIAPPAPEVTAAKPATTPATANASAPAAGVAPALPAASAASAAAGVKPAAPVAAEVEEAVNFQWPTRGNLIAGFDEAKNKGLDIAGKAGDPVLAAADGRVVYAGAGLRGYGNLIILKHNNTYLTAYAHNQTLLVKEDQAIKRGQKIAEMGNSDADQVKLHFEIRRQGKPVDPAKYLPAN
ncbi:peptidase [Limnohabitans sp. TS-CS-82]|jgi:lipoprotein NlpD|uniref:peptidoglycan DD-metalloendopeptidase family protein n=1 Tax=Limnohabitans sp. TS-CS-82 TaxID=2094193 RepID=UPI000CF21410|nr:peptidoglycan DD-metalloendopeptidase family protein [Limnohabitans sp. TS-CS-82]PQA84339.1 peptidase [Limnohabitans sp. TS-CS-82]